jgi:hypothetical protein
MFASLGVVLCHPLSSEVRSARRSVSTLLRKVGFADRVYLRGASVKVAAHIANFLTRVVSEIQAAAWCCRQSASVRHTPNLQRGAVANPLAVKPANRNSRAAGLFIPYSPLAQSCPVEKTPHCTGFYFFKSNGKDFLPFDLKI